ncbi:MAG: DegV family protein [Anaerolineales bacterium]|jgi:DegV family protein with EDD domain
MTVGVVTDSTCDIPKAEADRLGLEVVPAILVIGGRGLRDGIDFVRSEIYGRLTTISPLPTTAAPSTGAFEAAYAKLLKMGAAEVLSIHLSSQLSGICNAARVAAERFQDRVHVVDSGQVSLGLGFQVMAVAEAALQGASRSQLLGLLRDLKQRVRFIALIDQLENLRRSGRISWLQAELGTLLQIRLLVTLAGGAVERMGQFRTRSKAISGLMNQAASWGPFEQLAVLHVKAESEAHELLAKLRALPGLWPGGGAHRPWVVEATPLIGVHTGPGALGLAALSSPD